MITFAAFLRESQIRAGLEPVDLSRPWRHDETARIANAIGAAVSAAGLLRTPVPGLTHLILTGSYCFLRLRELFAA